ncbi:DUF421 domain-containing protein [Paenibacillus xerothermodurans]|uniref:DUF421 domain-containing protein n=2 Tax=Paenibacillus xerothermodurans TaxID=1977292 RepID=A0A2W1N998_PAEXE|nr:DUF421 domain-containing protein [Paenibacillus xerothermodurans]
MGRRSVGELPVFDFLIIISLGAVVGADIADPDIGHIHTAIAIVAIALLQKVYSFFLIRSRRFGKSVSFEPIVVIKDSAFIVQNLKKARYPIDNILQMLREKNIFDISEVDTAVIEANGKLTVFKKAEKSAATREDVGVGRPDQGVAYPIIIEGRIEQQTLNKLNLTEIWVLQPLERKKMRLSDVFFASVNGKRELNITTKQQQPSPPPILH